MSKETVSNPYKENPKLRLVPGRFYRDRDGTLLCCVSVENRESGVQTAVCAEVRPHGQAQRIDMYHDGMLRFDGQDRAPWIAEEAVDLVLEMPSVTRVAPFDEELHVRREQMAHIRKESKTPGMIWLAGAVEFLLAVAHPPNPEGVVEIGGASPAHEYTSNTEPRERFRKALETIAGLSASAFTSWKHDCEEMRKIAAEALQHPPDESLDAHEERLRRLEKKP